MKAQANMTSMAKSQGYFHSAIRAGHTATLQKCLCIICTCCIFHCFCLLFCCFVMLCDIFVCIVIFSCVPLSAFFVILFTCCWTCVYMYFTTMYMLSMQHLLGKLLIELLCWVKHELFSLEFLLALHYQSGELISFKKGRHLQRGRQEGRKKEERLGLRDRNTVYLGPSLHNPPIHCKLQIVNMGQNSPAITSQCIVGVCHRQYLQYIRYLSVQYCEQTWDMPVRERSA